MKKIGSAFAGYFRSCDKWLLFLWLLASGLSVLFLHALHLTDLYLREDQFVRTQLMACALGLVAAIIVSLIDYHFFLKLWKLYVPVCLILMLLTFTSMGVVRGDNRAWLEFSASLPTLQPSELLKISFITTFSLHIAKVRENINRLPVVLLLCLHGGAHIVLVQLQNDTGSSLVFLAIFLVMMFCAGIGWKYIAAAVAALIPTVLLFWNVIMSEDQKMRILVLFNPELSERYTYQQTQALNALVYGGMQGNGLFNADHNYIYVPEAYNDFIFSFIGEAAGFMGALGVVVLLGVICFKILFNSRVAKDDEGRFICIGVFAMIFFQIVINLGMVLGLLPVIGVTLPLFSAGGSSILSLYLGLGIVLSVYGHSSSGLLFDRG